MDFDVETNQFNLNESFVFPVGINGRTIVPLPNREALIITNNDYPYQVSLSQKGEAAVQ